MRTCSFLPAMTQMIYDMDLQDMLHGVTFECPEIALKEKLSVVRYLLEGKEYDSLEIDRTFSASKSEGKSLYYVDEPLLAQIAPDVIFTQDVCEVCQIDTASTAAAVSKLEKQPKIVPLTPQSLEDVFETAFTIAQSLNTEEAAYQYLNPLRLRIDGVIDQLRRAKAPLKRVMLMEWMDPIYNCGRWIPHQISSAGGIDMLSNPSGDSIETPREKILKYDPEVIVVAPCGFDCRRASEELHLLTERSGWCDIRAVSENRGFLADFHLFTQPSAGTLVDGIELLAGLFHPEFFEVPKNLRSKFQLLESVEVTR